MARTVDAFLSCDVKLENHISSVQQIIEEGKLHHLFQRMLERHTFIIMTVIGMIIDGAEPGLLLIKGWKLVVEGIRGNFLQIRQYESKSVSANVYLYYTLSMLWQLSWILKITYLFSLSRLILFSAKLPNLDYTYK